MRDQIKSSRRTLSRRGRGCGSDWMDWTGWDARRDGAWMDPLLSHFSATPKAKAHQGSKTSKTAQRQGRHTVRLGKENSEASNMPPVASSAKQPRPVGFFPIIRTDSSPVLMGPDLFAPYRRPMNSQKHVAVVQSNIAVCFNENVSMNGAWQRSQCHSSTLLLPTQCQ